MRSHEQLVIQSLERLQPDMLANAAGIRLGEADIEEIVEDLHRAASAPLHRCVDYLNLQIELGREILGWDIPLARPVLLVRRERNLASTSLITSLQRFDALERAMVTSFEHGWPGTPEARIGRLLCAAVLWGGLHQGRWVDAWLKAIPEGGSLWRDWYWVDMSAVQARSRISQKKKWRPLPSWLTGRRWVADPITQMLLLNWHREFPGDVNRIAQSTPWALLCAFRATLPAQAVFPSGLHELLQWARERACAVYPGFLSAYACGELPAVSVPAETWLRFLTGKRLRRALPPPRTALTPPLRLPPVELPRPSIPIDMERQFELLAELQRLLDPAGGDLTADTAHAGPAETLTAKAGKKLTFGAALKRVSRFRARHLEALSPALHLLILWTEQLFKRQKSLYEGRKGHELRPSTVKSYLSSVGMGLLEAAGGDDILDYLPSDFDLLYEHAIAYPSTSGAQVRAAFRLAQFHGYLMAFHGAVDVDFDIIYDEAGISTSQVDANIITPDEYRQVLGRLGWESFQSDRRCHMRVLMVILGYRCGLRRSEAQALQLDSVQDGIEPELLIRKTRHFNTKTAAARRRIPLSLLDEKELACLRAWLTLRDKEREWTDNDLLFHDPQCGSGLVPAAILIEPVVVAMREVTGDPTLSYHNLRHSFCNWLFLCLVLRDDIRPASLPQMLRDPMFSSKNRRALKNTLLANEPLGRKALFAVSMLAGHADVKTTIRNYCHLLDWLLAHMHRHPLCVPNLSVRALSRVSGLGQAMVYRTLQHAKDASEGVNLLAERVSGHHRKTWGVKPPGRSGRPKSRDSGTISRQLLPTWEKAYELYLEMCRTTRETTGQDILADVPKSRKDQLYAATLYGRLRQLESHRLGPIGDVLRDCLISHQAHAGSICIDRLQQGRDIASLLQALKIPKAQWQLQHRARIGQTRPEAERYRRLWAEEIGIDEAAVLTGKPINNSPKRGVVLLKICRIAAEGSRRQGHAGFGFYLSLSCLVLRTMASGRLE